MPNVSLTAPADYTVQSLDIERRRKLADMLQQQSMAPIEQQPNAGGWAVPISPWQGLGKVAQGFAGAMGQQSATQQQMALVKALRGDAQNYLGSAPQGSPASDRLAGDPMVADDQMNVHTPAQPPSSLDSMNWAMQGAMSGNPYTQSLAQLMLPHMLKGMEPIHARQGEKVYVGGQEVISNPRDPEFHPYQTTDANGKPVTQWYDSRRPPTQPQSVPVKREPVTTTDSTGQPQTSFIDPFTQITPLGQPVKMDMLNTGAGFTPVNQYTQREPVPMKGMSPFQQAEIGIQQQNAANTGQNTQFNTGQGFFGPTSTGPLGSPTVPQGAPQAQAGQTQPRPATPRTDAVAAAQGVTPKALAEIKADQYKQQQGAKQVLAQIQYDPETKADNVRQLIESSTGGYVPNAAANALGAFNVTTSGRAAIGQLEPIISQLTMGLMGGKLGSGISNADREFVIAQLGDIANANRPVGKRLAAWDSVVQRLQMIESGGANPPPTATTPQRRATDRPLRREGDKPAVVDFNSLPKGPGGR